jgi:hypothetical protein
MLVFCLPLEKKLSVNKALLDIKNKLSINAISYGDNDSGSMEYLDSE